MFDLFKYMLETRAENRSASENKATNLAQGVDPSQLYVRIVL